MESSPTTDTTLLTIGYEGTNLTLVLDALREAGARHLIDVRAIPQSRKPGFSKRLLAASLAEAGVGYTHLRGLGTPKAGREAVRHGDVAGMQRIYAVQLETAEAQHDLALAREIARGETSCLLCFERDHTHCHRDIVARLICDDGMLPLVHLQASLP
jgi:uncharacterized protein (DUF488 family)